MPQTQYNLHLKGFVGGADFDRNYGVKPKLRCIC